jgi:hypothetical protein
MDSMIVALVAAVILQPLDAEFSAADPKGTGVVVLVRHPGSWKPQPFAAPHALARLVSADGKLESRLWLTDDLAQFAARGDDQAAASAEFDFVDSGKLLEPFAVGNQIVVAGTTYLDGHPARFLELAAPNGARQFLVGRLAGRRGVILAVGALAADDFEANRAVLSTMAQSLRVEVAHQGFPWEVPVAVAAIIIGVILLHRRMNRVRGKPARGR